jgi:glycosyltransferase involved in cell wall biosynthesis
MIVIVAPYSPIGCGAEPSLGAARKLELIAEQLATKDESIVLVNSAHNSLIVGPLSVQDSKIGSIPVSEVTLPTRRHRTIGKLANLFHVRMAVRSVRQLGKPRLVWLYNGYAFEALFAREMRRYSPCPLVLEFEDWHFARGRGLNPKPLIDWFAWRELLPQLNHVFVVNAELAKRVPSTRIGVSLLPGIVPARLSLLARENPPFRDANATRLGFFGGLTREKGADLLLDLIDDLPLGFSLDVTGAGELEGAFERKAATHPGILRYHGQVSDQVLYELLANCDVILNPHSPISLMRNGVFPFKVIEAIASGRLLISTALPTAAIEASLQGVYFTSHSARGLREAVLDARAFFHRHESRVTQGAAAASAAFGEKGLFDVVDALLAAHDSDRTARCRAD